MATPVRAPYRRADPEEGPALEGGPTTTAGPPAFVGQRDGSIATVSHRHLPDWRGRCRMKFTNEPSSDRRTGEHLEAAANRGRDTFRHQGSQPEQVM